jgi:plasmid maintenance system antidote protein VapI
MSMKERKRSRPTTVSEALRDAITGRGLTAYAAAKRSGVSVDAIQRFLNEQRGLTLSTVDKLADSLGLTLCQSDHPTNTP